MKKGAYQQKTDKRKSSESIPQDPGPEAQDLNYVQSEIRTWLKKTRFKPALFGVSQADAWKKIGELNGLYEQALAAERARYDALLEERTRTTAVQLARRMVQQAMEGQKAGDESLGT